MNKKTGIVGGGNMAYHLKNYLDSQGIEYISWERRDKTSLEETLRDADPVIVLITDSYIEDFIKAASLQKTWIHFSGALDIDGVHGFHPLSTFNNRQVESDNFERVPFIGTSPEAEFRKLLPFLKNPYYIIPQKKKALYHALCVIAGNFTSILWNGVTRLFKKELNLPPEVLFPYLRNITENIKLSPTDSLTGPLKRRDKLTIKKNIKSLPPLWKGVYRRFRKLKENVYDN